jgi:ADP-ribose pyrophosphatase YjhB (NUDIX family)/GNAT superfamily N-acetyltransferase
MRVQIAHPQDIPAWLALAAEVEPEFGPLVHNPSFVRALEKNIARQTAFCVREGDGPPATPLMGGLLFSQCPPKYEIDWLAVARRWQRRGVGGALIQHVFGLVEPPGEMVLLTFAESAPQGQAAREFYTQFGFRPAELGPRNSANIPTQVFRRTFGHTPTVRAVIQRGDRVLLTQHHYINPENLGKWSLPGGRVDPDDVDRQATLRRELREELGAEIDIVRFLGTFAHKLRPHHIYLVHLQENGPLLIDAGEIAAAEWFTPADAKALHAEGRLFAPFILEAVLAAQAPP